MTTRIAIQRRGKRKGKMPCGADRREGGKLMKSGTIREARSKEQRHEK